MTTYPNQFSVGLIDHQLLAMIAMPVQSKTSVVTASAWVSNTLVKNSILSPVVFKVLNALAMDRAGLS